MKKHRLDLFGMLFFLLSIQPAMGQIPIGPDNGSFEAPFYNNLTIQTNIDCNTFSYNCSANIPNTICNTPPNPMTWIRSHGTPGVATSNSGSSAGPPIHGSQYLSMWAANGNGEGAYTNFTFNAGQTYIICMYIRLHWGTNLPPNPSIRSNGLFHIKAANGLQESSNFSNCGQNLPTPTDVVTIKDGNYDGVGLNAEWLVVSEEFTPNQTFSQLWFHPSVNGNVGIQPFFDVDDVKIYSCPPLLTFSDPGQTIPEAAQASNQVNIGTSFGNSSSVPVQNDPTATSLITAGNRIVFGEGTRISVNGNGAFHAFNSFCYADTFLCDPNIGLPRISPERINPLNLSVYPNPVGKEESVLLEMDSPYTGKVQVEIFDLQGRSYMKKPMLKEGEGVFKKKLDISNLPAGLYLLRATCGTEVSTAKLSVIE